MAVLHGTKKTTRTSKLQALLVAFIKRIEDMLVGYDEGGVVFDHCLETSIKRKTRQRKATSNEFEVPSEMKLTMSFEGCGTLRPRVN